MRPLYLSGDLEASGPYTPKYAMLSLGFVVVDKIDETFYSELKPISSCFDEAAMRVGCRGLSCVRERAQDPLFDVHGDRFDPLAVLGELDRAGEEPGAAMRRAAAWIKKLAATHKKPARGLYAPASFESAFLPYYFHEFAGEHPLGHSAEDASSYLHGALGEPTASLKDLGVRPKDGLTHHALEDAIAQALEFLAAERLGIENRIRRARSHRR